MQLTGSWCKRVSDIQVCAEIVLKADPDRFAAVMAAPVAMRDKLFPLHAFAIEVARAPWVTQESMIAEMRLQWWRDALAEIASGGPVRRHEVVTPLANVLSPKTAVLLDGFVEVRRWDIYREPFESAEHFEDYLAQTGGVFYKVLAQSVSVSDTGVADFGYAVAVANWLCAIPELERRGRIPLLDGGPDGVCSLAKNGLAALNKGTSIMAPEVRRAMLSGWQAKHVLRQAIKDPLAVADGRLGQSGISKRLSLMMKTAFNWI